LRLDVNIASVVLNQVLITGQISEKKPLRYTPSGVPVAEARLGHGSEQVEAELPRQVECEISLLAFGLQANWLNAAPLGAGVQVGGFLAARSRNSKALVLHVQTIEFLEGKENGQILQKEGR
jgi:primosomal replication protein N